MPFAYRLRSESDISAARPVDWEGLHPDISTTMSPASRCLVSKFFWRIYRIGILPLFPARTSGISAPRIQYTIAVLLPDGTSFPQSPLIVLSIRSEKVPSIQEAAEGLSMNHSLNIVCAWSAKLSFTDNYQEWYSAQNIAVDSIKNESCHQYYFEIHSFSRVYQYSFSS